METDTPDTDAKMFSAWKWDTHKMDYVPHGVGVPADFARKLERQRDKLKEALIEMRYSHTDKAERMAVEALGENDRAMPSGDGVVDEKKLKSL